MATCPICAKPLETQGQRGGAFYQCSAGHGRALSIPQLRRVAGDMFAVKLLRQLQTGRQTGQMKCPFCEQTMLALVLTDPPLDLGGCRSCGIVWFHPDAHAVIPEGATESFEIVSALAIEINARQRLKAVEEKQE